MTGRGERRKITKELMKRVRVRESKCWVFSGALDKDGFGHMRWDGKVRLAHQVFYEHYFGPVPEGSKLVHPLPEGVCVGAACCNPIHTKVWKPGQPKPGSGVKVCKKGHVIDENNQITENRKSGIIARCRICRQEAWREQKQKARAKFAARVAAGS